MKSVLGWHFLREDRLLGYGHEKLGPVAPGWVYSAKGPLALCENGMHASVRCYDALEYAPGPVLCRVRLSGEIIHGDDKVVARHREVLWMVDVSSMLRLFACWCVKNTPLADGRTTWDLLTNDRSRNAVGVAERHALGGATDEELAAARDAAWDAARDAALAAAWDAQRAIFQRLVDEAFAAVAKPEAA